MKSPPPLLFVYVLLAAVLPACQSDAPGTLDARYGQLVAMPSSCGNGDPSCNLAYDRPSQTELTTSNSQNLRFSSADGALTLVAGSGGAVTVDSDGDGVPDAADDCVGPGWRTPCDGDASNDGLYQTLYFDSGGSVTLATDVAVTGTIRSADAYILFDATGSMRGEQAQLVIDLTTGTFVDPVACPSGADTGLAGALKCVVPDLWMGMGQFHEYPLSPHGNPYGHTPYHHHLDTTGNLQHLLDAVSSLRVTSNRDLPEAGAQALYSIATGIGLGPWVPNRGACPTTPSGRWGYPCFRSGTLPIIIVFSDAEMYNGPRAGSPTYGNPPFDGTVGLGTRLPPVEQDPGMIYASSVLAAHDLGDLSNKSVTVMGTNVNLGNDFTTWDLPTCIYSGGSGFWGDGRDGVVRFSVDQAWEDAGNTAFLSGEGTFYPYVQVALLDSSLTYVDCNRGPGGGDWWGRMTSALTKGSWYLVSDSGVSPSSSVNDQTGPFQLRIQTTPDDPSWQTADTPISWTTVETELLAKGIKVVSIVSPNSGGLIGLPDLTELGIVTNSVDQAGNPYVQTIAGDGSGLGTAMLDAVRALVGDTRRDITIVAEDNLATAGIDESRFTILLTATQCPTSGVNNCLGGAGTDTCLGCLADSQISFQFRLGNDFVPSAASPQVFDFDLVALADGTVELNRIPVRVMVPEVGTSFGSGFYESTYDSDYVCVMPPERPDWGLLTWSGSTPSDSAIEFEFFTGNTVAELDMQIPVSIIIPADTTASVIDVGQELVAGGKPNFMPFLRVRAKLQASTDALTSPILEGWTMQFHCVPFD